ncbi:DNA-3-methyladenine glycosylase [Candidatus Marinamargulisbacteria bacterium SCGC AG-439-L15]|nr:DNA-3-methyladenine glycosylase [Candidatus Marinamargulisbacteria bacterium SCGC AG-439-L15]
MPYDKTMNRSFFDNETLEVARRLIGYPLIYEGPDGIVSGIISETEAYTQEDPACHTYNGRQTKRNTVMFGPPGHLYIYFIYGMYHCLNIVTEREGRGCAVLIRAVQPLEGIDIMKKNRPKIKKHSELANGPGKLVLAMGIPSSLNEQDLFAKKSLIYLGAVPYKATEINVATRVGIAKGSEFPWRFIATRFNNEEVV